MADRNALGNPRRRRPRNTSATAPEDTLFYKKTVQAHWLTFLAEVSSRAEPELPRFVLEEVEAFLKCEILAHGFLHVVCDEYHDNRLPLVPRPRKHVIRFPGLLAPAAGAQSSIVPRAKAAESSDSSRSQSVSANDNGTRDPIVCRSRLGSQLNYYHRAAA